MAITATIYMGDERLANARIQFEMGFWLDEPVKSDLVRANARALDVLSRVVGDSLDSVWLPGVEEGEARRMLGRAMVEHEAAPSGVGA